MVSYRRVEPSLCMTNMVNGYRLKCPKTKKEKLCDLRTQHNSSMAKWLVLGIHASTSSMVPKKSTHFFWFSVSVYHYNMHTIYATILFFSIKNKSQKQFESLFLIMYFVQAIQKKNKSCFGINVLRVHHHQCYRIPQLQTQTFCQMQNANYVRDARSAKILW